MAAALDGCAREAAVRYAANVIYEDVIVNGVLQSTIPLALSRWRRRTGLSELPPLFGPVERRAWTTRVQIDGLALRAYAQAVYSATDEYLARLTDPCRGEPTTGVLTGLLLRLS
jgi:hypothetical protein